MHYTIIMEFNVQSNGIGERSAELNTSDEQAGRDWVAKMLSRFRRLKEPILVEWYRSSSSKNYKTKFKESRYGY